MWQQLEELASELESDLRDIMDWGRKWLFDFNAEKANYESAIAPDFYVNSFFLRTECFPLTYDLSGFKSRINRHLLTVGSS